jgi:hypothetical protein
MKHNVEKGETGNPRLRSVLKNPPFPKNGCGICSHFWLQNGLVWSTIQQKHKVFWFSTPLSRFLSGLTQNAILTGFKDKRMAFCERKAGFYP